MSSSQGNPIRLTEPQHAVLTVIYEAFVEMSDWPTVQFVESQDRDHIVPFHNVYKQLVAMGLVSGVGDTSTLDPRGDLKVELSLKGLVQLPQGEGDADRLITCVRYLAGCAADFKPPPGVKDAPLVIGSGEISEALALEQDDAKMVRLRRLMRGAQSIATVSLSPSGGDWTVAIDVERARRFRGINSVEDYLDLNQSHMVHAHPVSSQQSAPDPPHPLAAYGKMTPTAPNDARAPDSLRPRAAIRLVADDPALEDLLDFEPITRALCGLLDSRKVGLPLAVAITAPWGRGKSSLMTQIKRNLDESSKRRGSRCTWRTRTWRTVSLDAWKYERGEHLWAALAIEIYSQSQDAMNAWEKTLFRLRLECSRRTKPGVVLTALWPCLAIAALVLAVATAPDLDAGTLPIPLAVAAGILGSVARYYNALANPFQRAIDRYERRPKYEDQLGFTAEADRDIQALTKLLAKNGNNCLAVFVDDLDRCSSAHVVEVVEAMHQLFNSQRDRRCVFVLGFDRAVVAANIDAAYADAIAHFQREQSGPPGTFGSEFLEKLVQLSVSLPNATPAARERLLKKMTDAEEVPTRPGAVAPLAEDVKRAQAMISDAASATLASIIEAASGIMNGEYSDRCVAEAVRRELAQLIEAAPEVAEAERAVLACLTCTPRQVKRFHNTFLLQLHVANETDGNDCTFTAEELVALARWVAATLFWSERAHRMAEEPELALLFEAQVNNDSRAAPPTAYRKDWLLAERDAWLTDGYLCELMTDADPRRRISAIHGLHFLRVT